jgi:hypothetical protein
MSAEKLTNDTEKKILTQVSTPEESKPVLPGRVDINILLARVREEKNRESKSNMVFFGLISSILIVAGLILSF